MYSYIPMRVIRYRKDSLSGVNSIFKLNESNNYKCIPPHKNSPYSRKKEFLESCNSSDYLNKRENIPTVTNVINSILESGTPNQVKQTVSFLTNDIIPKLESFNPFINGLNRTLLTEDYNADIDNTIKIYNQCDRVLSNDRKLSKRFDFNKYISEQCTKKSPRDLVFSLCEMIDTYNIPLKAKYNIALENVQYSLYNSPINNENVIQDVTDYFLLRESIIPDNIANGYMDILQNNQFLDPEELSKLRFTKINSRIKYIDKIEYMRNHDIDDEKTGRILDDMKNITTEDHASQYIKTVYNSIITDSTLTDKDKEILKKSIYMIPLISSIDKSFIDYECNKLDGQLLSTRDLLETVNFINETINESTIDTIGCANLHDIIEDFKIDQDKSPNKFIQLMNSINPTSNAMVDIIIKELPGLCDIIKNTYVLYSNQNNSVANELYDLVYRICNANPEINSYVKLVEVLNAEKMKASLTCTSTNTDGYDRIKEYINVLKKSISLVNNIMYSVDDVPYNESCLDDINKDDMSFEDYVSLIETLSIGMDNINKLNKEELLSSIADNIRLFTTDSDNLRDLSNVLMVSKSIDKSAYEDILIKTKDSTENSAEKLIIANEISYINTFEIKTDIITESLLIIEANNIINDLFNEVLTEATNNSKDDKKKKITFNDIQLGLKAFGNKIKNLNYKLQGMWKNVDMYGNNVIKGIQAAATSDRREQIIKGNIIPSFSKCIKTIIAIAGSAAVASFLGAAPWVGALISAVGIFATSKVLNDREKELIYDEIDTELKVVDKEIEMALADGDTNKYRFLLTYQKKLNREKMRIKYGAAPKGRKVPV